MTVLWVSAAQAKRTGQNMPCKLCHEGQDPPAIDVVFDAPQVQPGGLVTVTVTATHESALVGGVFLDSHGSGEFQLLDMAGTKLMAPTQATHSMPHAYVDGQLQFTFNWLAPSEPGITKFTIWANAANDNMMQVDDSPDETRGFVAHGCEGIWYYPDADGDGFGNQELGELSCEPIPELLTQGGDCDDNDTTLNPGIAEVCDDIDNNCDGQVDEGFDPQMHWEDRDGDGYGAVGGFTKKGCDIEGYAPISGDCDDKDPGVNPDIMEVLGNGIDDDCDSEIDEVDPPPETDDAPLPAMTGEEPSAMPTAAAPTAQPAPSMSSDGGGCLMAAGRSAPWPWALLALGSLWACGARRVRRPMLRK